MGGAMDQPSSWLLTTPPEGPEKLSPFGEHKEIPNAIRIH